MLRTDTTRFVAVLLVTACFAGSTFAAQNDCRLTVPRHLPVWSFSGAWMGEEVVFADVRQHEMLRYSPTAGYIGSMDDMAQAFQSFSPDVVRPDGQGGFVLQNGATELVRLTSAMRPGEEERVEGRMLASSRVGSGEPAPTVRSVFSWQPAGSSIVACSDLETGNNWRYGFVRIPQGRSGDAVWLKEITHDDPIRVYCRLGLDLIATQGSTAWVLMMEEHPRIFRFDAGSDSSDAKIFDPGLGTRPVLSFLSARDLPRVMSTLEASSLAVGLYSTGDGNLVVLSRRPVEDKTEWRLTRIDGENGKVLGVGVLPTQANHLTVVPGPKYWAFLERGAVRAMFDHEAVFGIRYIPTSRIVDLTSPTDRAQRICG